MRINAVTWRRGDGTCAGRGVPGFGPILGAIGRQTPIEWRSSALGIATAGGSFGQFAIVPFASILQSSLDNWHSTMFVLAAVSVTMVPLALGLREHRAVPAKADALQPQSSKDALQEAFCTQGFWLLTIGFFVCGFHVTFIGLHLPSYVSDHSIGLSFFGRPISAIELGGWAIGLVGLFNIIGTLLWGWLGGHHLRKDMLALLYALRALAFVLFLAIPLSWMSVLAFAASLGFLWLGTVPLTSGWSPTCSVRHTYLCCGVSFSLAISWGVFSAVGGPDASTMFRAIISLCGGYRSASASSRR
jgi:MFS family permease